MMSETFFYEFSTLCWLVFTSNFAMLLSPFSEASWGSRLWIEQKRIIIIVRQSMGSSRRSIISHLRNPGGLLSPIEPSLFAKTALNISKKLTHRWTVSHWCTPGLRDQIDSYRHLLQKSVYINKKPKRPYFFAILKNTELWFWIFNQVYRLVLLMLRFRA